MLRQAYTGFFLTKSHPMSDTLLDMADPELPFHILKRLPAAQATADAHAQVINARVTVHKAEFSARLRTLQLEPGAKKVKLQKLRALADDMTALAADQTACRKGCTHCCHTPVAMVQTEADFIGERIGRPAQKLRETVNPEDRGYGYHMPCPFLKDNACSIYAERPLSCRVHLNLDEDALLCELLPGLTVPVPLLDMLTLQATYIRVTPGDKLGDIRDFFPPAPAR